jgi:phosphoglycolate phosphatase
MAVLSNKPHESTLAVMKIYFPRREFRAILGARDGYPAKPDPSAALEIARLLGVKPEEIIYIGDTNTDMRTANAAGMYAVGALWGFRTAEELKSNGAKVLIEKPQDLLPLLAR